MNRRRSAVAVETPLLALLFLCFFQVLTDFVASVYALGLLQTGVPPEVGCVSLLVAPVVLLGPRRITATFVVLTGELMLLSRMVSLAFETRGKMWAAGIGTAAFLLCFPSWLRRLGENREREGGSRLSLALAQAARALGYEVLTPA